MANELQNKSPADTYKDVLQLGTATTSTRHRAACNNGADSL